MAAPRDDKGHFIPLDCPNPLCCGRLHRNDQYGEEVWSCDGLVDPEDDHKELQPCAFEHVPGRPYQPSL